MDAIMIIVIYSKISQIVICYTKDRSVSKYNVGVNYIKCDMNWS